MSVVPRRYSLFVLAIFGLCAMLVSCASNDESKSKLPSTTQPIPGDHHAPPRDSGY